LWPSGCGYKDSPFARFVNLKGTPADAQRIIDGCDDALRELFHVGQKVMWDSRYKENSAGYVKVCTWPKENRQYKIYAVERYVAGWSADIHADDYRQWVPLCMLTPVEERKETTMDKVTIQDVLDAGGEIFGLPCRCEEFGEGFCCSVKARVANVWANFRDDRGIDGSNSHMIKSAELEVVPGGVMVAQDDDENLYRVISGDDEYLVRRGELLIPENTALKAAQQKVTNAQKQLEEAQAELSKLENCK